MIQQQKVAKQMRKKDQLIELPDGILFVIMSKLTLKEAVRTSLLSKSWRFIWTCHPDLLFNSVNVLGNKVPSYGISFPQPDLPTQSQRFIFIEQVDRIMMQRFTGPKINSLTIHYNLGEDCASYISRWISCAVIKGVEKINLDLSKCNYVDHASSTVYEQYIFPCSILASSRKGCTIKHLQLASCSLRCIPCSNMLNSLVTVEFRYVKISDQQMERFLLISPSLERLTLDNCEDLVHIKFSVLGLRLKFLSICSCFRLESINICAEDLLMLDYTGHWVRFYFKSVPRLGEVFLNFTGMNRVDGVAYALSTLAYDLPQLQTLNLVLVQSLKTLNLLENVPTFRNIKQLLLTVLPFHDEDELSWISYVLKAFPFLSKLQLNLFSPGYIKQSNGINRQLPECLHSHLRELEIYGFYGYQHEVDLLNHLLNNLVELKILVISPSQRLYKGLYNWDFEEPNSSYKLSSEIVEWLHVAAPPTVQLQVR